MTFITPNESLDRVELRARLRPAFFDREVFILYGTMRLRSSIGEVGQSDVGYRYRLVAHIGRAATGIHTLEDWSLAARFYTPDTEAKAPPETLPLMLYDR